MTKTITTAVKQGEVFLEVEAVALAVNCDACGSYSDLHDTPSEWEFDSVCPECDEEYAVPDTSIEGFDCAKCGMMFDLWETSYIPTDNVILSAEDGETVTLTEDHDEYYCKSCAKAIVDDHNEQM